LSLKGDAEGLLLAGFRQSAGATTLRAVVTTFRGFNAAWVSAGFISGLRFDAATGNLSFYLGAVSGKGKTSD